MIINTFPWIKDQLVALLSFMEREPQAVLLTGVPGIGKSELGRELAAAMLCEQGRGRRPACGECPACHWFAQDNHPDFRMLTPILDEGKGKGEPAFEIKIAQIREIAEFVTTGAHRAGKRIILVDPADALNTVSANALLKTLEEPTEELHYLLVSSNPQRLPATLRSRCIKYPVVAPSLEISLKWLSSQSSLPESQLLAAMGAAGGSPRAALGMLDPARKAAFDSALALIAGLPEADLMSTTDRMSQLDPRVWIDLMRRWTLDIARVFAGAPPRTFAEQAIRLQKLAKKTDLARLSAISTRLDRQSVLLSRPLNPRLYCESVLFDYLGAFKN